MTDRAAEETVDTTGALVPTDYLRAMAALLQRTEPELWSFFSGSASEHERAATRQQLLQHTVRLAAADYPEVHAAAGRAAAVLGITDPVVLYQAHGAEGHPDHGNAFCVSLSGEVHVVFAGRLLEQLDESRLLAVLGHELSHHLLHRQNDGVLEIADRMLTAAAVAFDAQPSHIESAHRFRLHVETSADRGALLVSGDLIATVEALVSVSTGLVKVAGPAYLAQAREVIADETRTMAGDSSHPELYIRAHALELWADPTGRVEAERLITGLLHGEDSLENLDLLDQHRLTDLTRRLVGQVLRPAFLQTDALLGQAGQFGARPAADVDEALAAECRTASRAVQDYLAAVLLDLATCDPDVEEVALAQTLVLADRVGLIDSFEPFVAKELSTGVRAVRAQLAAAPELLERAGP